jgi:catechol 2,3-dioxygenase-like lactoylglutathione lyase family enzyme
MNDDNANIVSHVSLGTNDFVKAVKFYDAVMTTIGARRVMEHPGAVAYGRVFPEFWVQKPFDGKKAQTANGIHVAFLADSKEMVRAFWDAALANGATGDGEPGERPHYGAPYYGCFLRDPDGHKIEAMYWNQELANQIYSKQE